MKNERTFDVESEQQREHLSKFVLKCPFPFQATLGPLRERRTSSANARLWLLHTEASKVTGYMPDELHELMLCKHYGYAEKTLGGVTIRVPLKRSSTRDKKEFSEFMDFCENFYGSEFGVWLPAEEIA